MPPLVDLAITKSHQGSLKVGREVTYRLAVVNNGPTADPGPVTVTDELPTGLSYVSATGDGWACSASGQTVTCEDADGLAVDERTVIRLVVAVGAAAYPSVTNVASVTSPAEDTDPDNNIAEDPADVAPSGRPHDRQGAVVDLADHREVAGDGRQPGPERHRLRRRRRRRAAA